MRKPKVSIWVRMMQSHGRHSAACVVAFVPVYATIFRYRAKGNVRPRLSGGDVQPRALFLGQISNGRRVRTAAIAQSLTPQGDTEATVSVAIWLVAVDLALGRTGSCSGVGSKFFYLWARTTQLSLERLRWDKLSHLTFRVQRVPDFRAPLSSRGTLRCRQVSPAKVLVDLGAHEKARTGRASSFGWPA